MTDFKALAKLERKAMEQSAVEKPGIQGGGCWALRRSYTGSLFPGFVNCQKRPRPGHLTCSHHRDREAAAQELKAGLAEGRSK